MNDLKKFLDINNNSKLFKSFKKANYRSLKYTNYFHIYDELFKNFIDEEIVFVEVGVSNGGSLFMWRDFFGPKARIIGIDFNPTAKKWEQNGFEIFIGNQADPNFWKEFYLNVGEIDILVDDGGHTNDQQIQTLSHSYKNIKKGGLIVVEDTHSSYIKEFGNPSPYSFINFSYNIVEKINQKFFNKSYNYNFQNKIFKVEFYESLVAFHIDQEKSQKGEDIDNNGTVLNSDDYRFKDQKIISNIDKMKNIIRKFLPRKIYSFLKYIYPLFKFIILRIKKKNYKKFFS